MDHDLEALQEARDLMRQARQSADAFSRLAPEKAWEIAHAIGPALAGNARHYAEWAVRETQIGKVEDKVFKNRIACERTLSEYGRQPLGGVQRDRSRNIVAIGRPAGVIVALSNSTSPVATIIFKGLLAMLTRNAIVFSPHPVAKACCAAVVEEMHALGVAGGAPPNWIQIQSMPTLQSTDLLMKHDETNLIVATGGTPMVRAAYRSGNPTIGVGAGNVPVYVDASADAALAAAQIVQGKNFDYGSGCTCPSVALVHASCFRQVVEAMLAEGAHVCSPNEAQRVQEWAYPGGTFNARIVAKSSHTVAEGAGIAVHPDCAALVCPIVPKPGHPMLKEKLSPILSLVCVRDIEDAIDIARMMLAHSGAGHTSGIHTASQEQAVYWGAALDYYRVVVNGVTTTGATGTDTGLPYTFTVGTGYAGKSSVSVNMGPELWVDYKRVAFPLIGGAPASKGGADVCAVPTASQCSLSAADIQRMVCEELEVSHR